MKKGLSLLTVSFSILLLSACATQSTTGNGCVGLVDIRARDIHWYLFQGRPLRLGHFSLDPSHVEEAKPGGAFIIENSPMVGSVQKRPLPLSTKHDDIIRRAEGLYSQKRFREAAGILYPAFLDEPDNLFLLNELARTLYRIEDSRSESFHLYKKLVSTLDSCIKNEEEVVYVDLWFWEAYWKIGSLYLGRKEYDKGAFEITRGMLGMLIEDPDQPAFEQALFYLCETFFLLENYDFARYFGCKALEINPKNTYVLDLLEKMNGKRI